MSLYIAHPLDDSLESINLYTIVNGEESVNSICNISEIGLLNQDDQLVFLIPASLITSYIFIQNKNISSQINKANFISEIDSKIVDQVSENEYLFHADNAFVINKKTLATINTSLSPISASIFVVPEYCINHEEATDTITQIGSKYLFSYSDGSGFGLNEDFLDQYLDIVFNDRPDFYPKVSCSNKDLSKRFEISSELPSFSFSKLAQSDLSKLPNFFKLKISADLLIKKLNFSKGQILACAISIIILVSAPNFLIYKNESNTKIYSNATFDIFKTINKDTKRVISPKSQIDQLLKGIPDNPSKTIKLPNLQIFYKLGSKYLTQSSIDLNNSSATVSIKSMPEFQYRLIQSASAQFGVSIANEDVDFKNGFVSGDIDLRFDNE